MRAIHTDRTVWLVGILMLLTLAGILKGCDSRDASSPAAPDGPQARKIVLTFAGPANPAAKTAGLTIDIIGLNDDDKPVGPMLPTLEFSNPAFPLAVPVELYYPPCRYRVTITASLSQNPARTKSVDIDICEWTGAEAAIDTFEDFSVGTMTIDAPDVAEEGAAITVSCEVEKLDAPDMQRYPPLFMLSEVGGKAIYERLNLAKQTATSKMTHDAIIAGQFYDPHASGSPQSQRVFTCSLDDGKSTPVTVTKAITRNVIPPTPTPTEVPACTLPDCPDGIYECPPDADDCLDGCGLVCASSTPAPAGTAAPTPTPIDTPVCPLPACPSGTYECPAAAGGCPGGCGLLCVSATPTPTPTPTVTPTPTPIPDCVVGNTNDTGPNSLREVISLINVGTITCPTVTFAPGVADITLLSAADIQITTANPLTIDGGSGVTISGFDNARVVYVGSGADVTLLSLTIRDGTSSGIYNRGTLTVGSGTIVRNNNNSGISNISGTLTIANGAVIGGPTSAEANTAIQGGGINNDGGMVTIYGTVSNNLASSYGGGISNANSGTVDLYGTVDSNSGGGGGIYNTATATIYGTVSNNVSSASGGGIVSVDGLTLESSAMISGNSSPGNGGGMYVGGTTIVKSGATIENNTATGYGGGISTTTGPGTLTMSGTVRNNEALGGGGIYVYGSATAYIDGLVEGNKALVGRGGGVSFFGGGSITGIVQNNQALDGGGISFWTPPSTLFDATVEGNTATGTGGGIYIRGGFVNFDPSHVIQGNTAPAGNGGGMYNNGGTLIGSARNFGTGNTSEDCMPLANCP